jgi:HTH-type transcriptional regulator, sugar sensing transcriptional regulator
MAGLSESLIQAAYQALMALGFGNYEARAYCALLEKSPANGYQIAQQSGIPRAKIYECLQRLVNRGAAIQVESQDAEARLFAPTDPDALLDGIEDGLNTAVNKARTALESLEKTPRIVEVLWRVISQQDIIERGIKLAEKATTTLHVAIWSEEFDALLPALSAALDRGVKIALVLYSPHPGLADIQKRCTGAILHSRSKRQAIPIMGRQFVLVADRERCITGSIFPDDDVEGVYTLNLGLVTNAVDLVNHEIYLERVMVEVGKPLAEIFGADLERLDPFDPPESIS